MTTTPTSYGQVKITKIRAAYNELREAIASGDLERAQEAFDRYEQWSDYIMVAIRQPAPPDRATEPLSTKTTRG